MLRKKDPKNSKKAILEAAFAQIYRHGFHAAKTDDIIAATNLTRGALYHHFKSKHDLAKAVITDVIAKAIEQNFIEPLKNSKDPIASLSKLINTSCREMTNEQIALGCPLNNLALEMSPIDEEFRTIINEIYKKWEDGVANALTSGQKTKKVRSDIDARQTACFILASLAGSRSLAKNANSKNMLNNCIDQLTKYINSLSI